MRYVNGRTTLLSHRLRLHQPRVKLRKRYSRLLYGLVFILRLHDGTLRLYIRKFMVEAALAHQASVLKLELLEPLLRRPDEWRRRREEQIDLLECTARDLRIEAVDDGNGEQVENGMNVEGIRSESAEHLGCGERHGAAADAPT